MQAPGGQALHVAKARFLRPFAEKLITKSKKAELGTVESLHNRREVLKTITPMLDALGVNRSQELLRRRSQAEVLVAGVKVGSLTTTAGGFGRAQRGNRRQPTAERRERLRGLYAVTPDTADTTRLAAFVTAAIDGGASAIQYRNKIASPALRREQAQALADVLDGVFGRPAPRGLENKPHRPGNFPCARERSG